MLLIQSISLIIIKHYTAKTTRNVHVEFICTMLYLCKMQLNFADLPKHLLPSACRS